MLIGNVVLLQHVVLQLLQAAGKVEERIGNITAARNFYNDSLLIMPSAPTLVAYALLEIQHPLEKPCNQTKVSRLFEEAILLDPRHGPAYNAYGNIEVRRGNVEKARRIFQNGIKAHCRDLVSVYHGLAKLEISQGNVEEARHLLQKGLKAAELKDGMMDNSKRKRELFLTHTLGMLELKSNRAAGARKVFTQGIQRHGNDSQLLLGAAMSEVKLGNEQSARILFEKSVNVDRKHAQAWQSWGVMEMLAGNYKVAKILFECGIQNDPRHGALWQAYGKKCHDRRNIFCSFLLLLLNNEVLLFSIATMESRLGNVDVARAYVSLSMMS